VDPQLEIIAIAVAGAALAGFGLLLTWYRRDRKSEHKKRWPFIATGVTILVLAVTGVALTFLFNANTRNTSISAEPSKGPINPGVPTRLSESQYREKVSAACSQAKEKTRRIDESKPQESPFGAQIEIEQWEVGQIEALQPPDELENPHESLVSVWRQRIRLLKSTDKRLPQLSDKDLEAELAAADRLAEQMTRSFDLLGVPECTL